MGEPLGSGGPSSLRWGLSGGPLRISNHFGPREPLGRRVHGLPIQLPSWSRPRLRLQARRPERRPGPAGGCEGAA